MEIQHSESGTKGSFFIDVNGKREATLTYSLAGANRIIIDHTEVSPALKGKNAGKQLVAAAVDYARRNEVKILPLCPFAKSVFERVTEYQDVLDK